MKQEARSSHSFLVCEDEPSLQGAHFLSTPSKRSRGREIQLGGPSGEEMQRRHDRKASRHDRKASKNRERFTEQENQSRINHSKRSVGRYEVHSWTTATKQSLCLVWQKVKVQLMLSMSFLAAVFWYCRRLYGFLAQLLKRCSNYLQRKLIRNLSVLTEVDLLGYSAREWKGETKQAKLMREAYEELFWSYHIKYLRQVRRDNYCVLRAVLFQIFSQGIPFPSWMKERDILKLPEKLLYSQGCNWIQQYSFGPERYMGPNAFGKLRKCMETLKTNWTEISATKDHEERGNMCNTLFSDESKEHKLYEAIKFIMLYEVVEAYEQIKSREEPIHNLFSLLLARDSSSDPLSFMMNHLNSVGDSLCLDQVELCLLGYLLEVKIRVYRLHRFNTEEFQVNYPDEYRREWNEISLLTEDDRYYHIPLFRT